MQSKARHPLPPFLAPSPPSTPAPLPPGEFQEEGWQQWKEMQKEALAPPLPAQAPLATKDCLLFPPLNVFLGHEMPPPATPAVDPGSPSDGLGGFTSPKALEGRAAGRRPVPEPQEQAALVGSTELLWEEGQGKLGKDSLGGGRGLGDGRGAMGW